MADRLTKHADFAMCHIYKTYLQRVQDKMPKQEARRFSETYGLNHPAFSQWPKGDFSWVIMELAKKNLISIYIGGSFLLEDEGIIYMENRLKNGLAEVTDLISKFIP